eukprot:jgi/Phyca11/99903/e_gw1.4.761.1
MKTYRDAVVDNNAQSFQHSPAATALPPLPAYDGIGGSPSYYYDNAQMHSQSSQHVTQPDSKKSRQAEGDDGQEGMPGKPVIRAIQEDVEDGDDNAEGQIGLVDNTSDKIGDEMAELSLNDSTDQPSSPPVLTPRILHFSDTCTPASSEPWIGTTHSSPLLFDKDQQYDPMHLMMQLFDITVENRPQLLSDGPSLNLALNVLDRTPDAVVDNFASMKKKRHIGNDFVHVVFKEYDEDYDIQTLPGQFNDVHIIIQPLNDSEYRTEVHVKPGIPPFGPLYGKQIISSSIISESVRITCLNANLACQVFHQELVGFALNCEERLKQIKQLGLRLATADEWKLDD